MTHRASSKAKELIAHYGYTPPIDVYAVAQDQQLQVLANDLEPYVSGLLVRSGKRGIIAVNKNHHVHRQRFTIAHEIGHFVLNHERSQFVDAAPVAVLYRDEESSQGHIPEEIEANAFAAELLMPEAVLRKQLRTGPIDAFDDIALGRLTSLFEVSMQALTIRLMKLNLIRG